MRPDLSPRDAVHVVVVDDHEATLYALSRILKLQGYTVTSVGTGADALEAVRATRPLCVVLDLHLPDMEGEALAKIWRNEHGGELVIVGVTAYADRHKDAEAAGVDYVFQKPVDPEKLKMILPPL